MHTVPFAASAARHRVRRLLASASLAFAALGAGLAVTLLATVSAGAGAQIAQQPAGAADVPLLFRAVRVFDGERLLGARDVLVRDGRIAAIDRSIAVPAGATVIDGSGRTLLPGLIDAHVHAFEDALQQALVFGVTTELGMFTAAGFAADRRAAQQAGAVSDRADLFSAGTLVTAPGGHGTEYGLPIPTLSAPDSAQQFVDARLAEGSDWIKIVYDDGRAYGLTLATLDSATLHATIAAARRRSALTVVHPGSYVGARTAIDAGAHGLAHLFVDSMPDAGFGRRVAERGAFVIPTLTVLRSITGMSAGAPLLEDARLAPYLTPVSRAMLAQSFPHRDGAPRLSYDVAVAAVRQLKAAGVPILAGTDAANPGTAHGASMHGELALLVEAGLTPVEALAAATSVPARTFGLDDRGRIAPGLRADLVLVTGDPTRNVTATRDIVGIWKGGVAVDRMRPAAAAATAARAAAEMRQRALEGDGLVSDFEQATPVAAFGAGWMVSTDGMAGGRSTASMEIAAGGAGDSGQALAVTGVVDAALPYAWAGVMLSPGERPMAPADLSARRALRFRARGDGGTYRVMLFLQSKGQMPVMRTFVAGPEWAEHVFPFSEFGTDGRDVMGVVIAAGPAPGPFAFRLDDVRFR